MTVIAMTREIGSLGTEVAAGLAARLGLKIIHSDLVASSIAERLAVEASAVLRYVNGTATLLERWQIGRRKLFHYAAEETLRLAQHGNVLIKGWGAATLLRDVPGVIGVRVCAPMEFRVRVVMDRLGTTDAGAVREQIERYDAARARTMRAFFNVEQEDARFYHIVLNTERISVEACINTVSELAKSPRFRDNSAIRLARGDKLLDAETGSTFVERHSLTAMPLGVAVSVTDRKVTLLGTTTRGSVRKRAENIVEDVAGASGLDGRIVSLPNRGRALCALPCRRVSVSASAAGRVAITGAASNNVRHRHDH